MYYVLLAISYLYFFHDFSLHSPIIHDPVIIRFSQFVTGQLSNLPLLACRYAILLLFCYINQPYIVH